MSRNTPVRETLIIEGASSGTGSNLAKHALQAGFSVALLARSADKLQQLQHELISMTNNGQQISIFPVDLTSAADTATAINEIAVRGPIQGLINCAATWIEAAAVEKLSNTTMHRSLELNFFTAFNTIKALLALTAEQKTLPLTIVNLGATASLRGAVNFSAYAVAKSALRVFSQSLAKELGPKMVHVAHVIIDGVINNERIRAKKKDIDVDKLISMDAISTTILELIDQHPSCWTFELDLRPYREKW